MGAIGIGSVKNLVVHSGVRVGRFGYLPQHAGSGEDVGGGSEDQIRRNKYCMN